MASDNSLESLRSDLASACERLDDLIMDELSAAIERGETTRPELERRLTRARNAIERAIGLLREE
jgi:ElaB/YqjD/DUF883 family membrane-anchored ribosome-binding protein